MSVSKLILLGLLFGVGAAATLSAAYHHGFGIVLPAIILSSSTVSSVISVRLLRTSPRRSAELPRGERAKPGRRARTYREGGRAGGAPWGLLLADGDPYAIPALEAYAAAAAAAGEADVAAEVRATLKRWKGTPSC